MGSSGLAHNLGGWRVEVLLPLNKSGQIEARETLVRATGELVSP